MTTLTKAARDALPHFEEALDSALEQLQEATIKYAGYKQDKIAGMEREYQAGRAALATLRAALAEQEAQAGEFVLVPVEPTPEMCAAGFCVSEAEHDPAGVYRAMLAARPAAPAPVALTDEQIAEIGHRMAWRYRQSSDPNHSDTYTFNRARLVAFARAIVGKEGGA